jgi:hypothetical protein
MTDNDDPFSFLTLSHSHGARRTRMRTTLYVGLRMDCRFPLIVTSKELLEGTVVWYMYLCKRERREETKILIDLEQKTNHNGSCSQVPNCVTGVYHKL